MKNFFQNGARVLTYWKLAIFRAMLYAMMTAGATHEALTHEYDDAKWKALGSFGRQRIYRADVLSGATVLLAFLDQSIARLKGGKPGEKKDEPEPPLEKV